MRNWVFNREGDRLDLNTKPLGPCAGRKDNERRRVPEPCRPLSTAWVSSAHGHYTHGNVFGP